MVGGNILTQLNNSTCSLMAQLYGNITKGVTLVFMNVSSADTCLFNLYENLIVADFGNRKFKNLNLLCACKNFFRESDDLSLYISPYIINIYYSCFCQTQGPILINHTNTLCLRLWTHTQRKRFTPLVVTHFLQFVNT